MKLRFNMPDFKDSQVKKKTVILAVMAAALLMTVTVTALALTSQNFFCAKACHFLMKYDVGAFEQSSHANIQCVACHTPPNIVGYIEHKLGALGELKMTVFGTYEWPINARAKLAGEIPSENCNTCHSIESRKVTPSTGVIINHKVHIDKGIGCASCHNRVGHPNLTVKVSEAQLNKLKEEEAKQARESKEKSQESGKKEGEKSKGEEATKEAVEEVKVVNGKFTYTNLISMEGCTRCHGLEANSKAPGKCELCHTKGFDLKPENHKVASWLQFAKTQRADHGQGAKAPGGKRYCSECHAQSFCENCHRLKTLPHPESFKVASAGRAEHAVIGQSNPAACQRCHTEEKFCTACHHKGYQQGTPWAAAKGVTQVHPGIVKEKGAENCFKCHDERYCSSCHTQGQPNQTFLSRRR
ncbi:MAG: NapC/NirT family cytochrome c [Actinobacteria bacterium]|nr:NapC/NirT family cytochrome c [Actinomycetota bacterium]